jgi:hypothetical protein
MYVLAVDPGGVHCLVGRVQKRQNRAKWLSRSVECRSDLRSGCDIQENVPYVPF